MSKKLMLLALTAVSAAMFAVPAVASAGEWTLEPGNQIITAHNKAGTTTVLTTDQNEEIICTSASGEGTVNAAGNGGTISLLFHGCKEQAVGTSCTTAGHTTGTITANGNWTSVYLTHNKTTPGLKIEGPGSTKELALFKCGFGLVTVRVEGSVIGHVEQACGTKGKEFSVNFESTANGVQKYTTNTLTGTPTDLTAYRNGVARTASQDGTGIITTQVESTLHCA